MTGVDVVVVSWRSEPELHTCLGSIASHASRQAVTTTVVDSGSGDGTADRVAGRWPGVRVVPLVDNVGFAAAANRGIATGDADTVLLLNPDTRVGADSVARLVACLGDASRAFGVVPLLVGTDGRPQHRWQLRRLPTPWRLATGRPGAPAFRHPPDVVRPVPQPAAAAWLVRRERWRELGGFDPRFRPAWWEDVDLCARLAEATDNDPAAGFVVEPRATVVHAGGSSVSRLGSSAFLRAYHRNLLRYAAVHHPHRLTTIRTVLRTVLLLRGVSHSEIAAAREGLE